MHTHTHTHAHACTHTYRHTHACTHTYGHIHTRTQVHNQLAEGEEVAVRHGAQEGGRDPRYEFYHYLNLRLQA